MAAVEAGTHFHADGTFFTLVPNFLYQLLVMHVIAYGKVYDTIILSCIGRI